jgi:hypothetical protein
LPEFPTQLLRPTSRSGLPHSNLGREHIKIFQYRRDESEIERDGLQQNAIHRHNNFLRLAQKSAPLWRGDIRRSSEIAIQTFETRTLTAYFLIQKYRKVDITYESQFRWRSALKREHGNLRQTAAPFHARGNKLESMAALTASTSTSKIEIPSRPRTNSQIGIG